MCAECGDGRLYKVVRERRYNGGRGDERVEAVEVLYCGYDRAEAVRVHHANPGSGYDVPGHHFTRVRRLVSRKAVA